MIRVLIAAESEMARRGLESILADAPSIEVVASLNTLADLGRSAQAAAPDVVVAAVESGVEEWLQEFTPGMGGSDAQPAFVILAPDPQAGFSLDLQQAGIAALLPLDATTGQVLASINAAAEGLIVLHPAMTGPEAEKPRSLDGAAPQLTAREREILAMLAEGLGNKEIAWRLEISEHTVKFHVSSIFTKLDVSSRAEAVSLGFRLGLILI